MTKVVDKSLVVEGVITLISIVGRCILIFHIPFQGILLVSEHCIGFEQQRITAAVIHLRSESAGRRHLQQDIRQLLVILLSVKDSCQDQPGGDVGRG